MKNEKGITMIALVLTLVVMSILSGIVISSGAKHLKKVELQDLITNMLLIEAKAKIGIEEVAFKTVNITEQARKDEIKSENLLGKEVDLNSQESDISSTLNLILSDDDLVKKWYYLENVDLEEIGLYELMNVNDENNYYVYTYDEGTLEIDVIYTGGYIHSDNNTYYKLSQLENLPNT